MLTTFKGLELHIKFRYFFLRFSLKMLYNSFFISYEKYVSKILKYFITIIQVKS